jgi:hypothetical protein
MLIFYPCLCRSRTLACLPWLTSELAFGVNNKVVDNFLSFPESLGSPLLDIWISVYS